MQRPDLRLAIVTFVLLVQCGDEVPYLDCGSEMRCLGETRLCYSSTGPAPASRSVRYCTKRCSTPAARSSECPGNAACSSIGGGFPVCVPRCTTVGDCPFSGAACRALTELPGVNVCTTPL